LKDAIRIFVCKKVKDGAGIENKEVKRRRESEGLLAP